MQQDITLHVPKSLLIRANISSMVIWVKYSPLIALFRLEYSSELIGQAIYELHCLESMVHLHKQNLTITTHF